MRVSFICESYYIAQQKHLPSHTYTESEIYSSMILCPHMHTHMPLMPHQSTALGRYNMRDRQLVKMQPSDDLTRSRPNAGLVTARIGFIYQLL